MWQTGNGSGTRPIGDPKVLNSPESWHFKGIDREGSRAPHAGLPSPLPPPLCHFLPSSRDATESPPEWDDPPAGRTDTSESKTGILVGKTKEKGCEKLDHIFRRGSCDPEPQSGGNSCWEEPDAHLLTPAWWNWGRLCKSPCRAQRECRRRPCQRAEPPETRRWGGRPRSTAMRSTQGGCRPEFLRTQEVRRGGLQRETFVGGGWEEAMGVEWLGTLKLSVRRVLKHRPRPEVYDLDIHRFRVYHYVLVFDVQVHDTAGVNESKRFDHLMENPIGKNKEPGR